MTENEVCVCHGKVANRNSKGNSGLVNVLDTNPYNILKNTILLRAGKSEEKKINKPLQ